MPTRSVLFNFAVVANGVTVAPGQLVILNTTTGTVSPGADVADSIFWGKAMGGASVTGNAAGTAVIPVMTPSSQNADGQSRVVDLPLSTTPTEAVVGAKAYVTGPNQVALTSTNLILAGLIVGFNGANVSVDTLRS